MKIVLTGGCTGGHIYPALAIGDKFREKDSHNEIIYIAHPYGLETKIVPAAGYELKLVTAQWIDRSNPIRIVKTIAGTLKGRREAYKIMKEFKPDVVVSTGSFVSVPVVLAAKKLGVPIYIHEQNAFPGVSNRMFSRYARKVFLGFNGGHEFFKEQEKLIYSGNPVRKEFYGRDSASDRKELGINDNDRVIMLFGGSLGSDTINEIGAALSEKYYGVDGITVLWGTGRDYYESIREDLNNRGILDGSNVMVSAYINNMPAALSASDVVISRSGALSVAEITMTGCPAIFIPSPNVTADHQYHNAKAVADVGGAVIVRESENTTTEVIKEVTSLMNSSERIAEMKQASLKIAPVNATDLICEEIMRDLSTR